MLLEIKPNSKKPIYEQLILEIKRGVVNQELLPGESMPGVRVLASDLGINMHTVNKVYKYLENEHILVKGKSGFVVNPEKLTRPEAEVEEVLKEKLYELVMEKELFQVTDEKLSILLGEVKELIARRSRS
jgi:DNA-binding transcriptional regulator YhcF (GntR family)